MIVNGLPDDPIADVAKAICERGGEAIPKAGDVSDENSAWACVELVVRPSWATPIPERSGTGRLASSIATADDGPACEWTAWVSASAASHHMITVKSVY